MLLGTGVSAGRVDKAAARVSAQLGKAGCRLRSYLDSAAAHGITALDAISSAIAGNPWLPPPPALA